MSELHSECERRLETRWMERGGESVGMGMVERVGVGVGVGVILVLDRLWLHTVQ